MVSTAPLRLLMWALTLDATLSELLHLFPLTGSSITCDVKTPDPQSSALNRTCPLLFEDSEYSNYDTSVLYDGSFRSVLNLNLSAGVSSPIDSFTFAFTIMPDFIGGVLFEYRALDEPGASTVSRVRAELVQDDADEDRGAVRLTLGNGTSDLSTFMISDYELENGKWKRVLLMATADTIRIIIGSKTSDGTTTLQGLSYPGTLRVGESMDHESYFVGKINCVAFFSGIFSNEDSYKDECTDYPASYAPLTGLPVCPAYNPDEPKPLHLWPLTVTSLGYDVTNMTTILQPADWNSTCPDLHVDKSHGYPSWLLDGSADNQIQIGVIDELYSFSLALTIMTPAYNVVLWEYVADAPADGEIAHFYVFVTSGGLRVELKDRTGTVLGDISSGDPVDLTDWKWVVLSWHYGLGQVTVIIKDKETRVDVAAMKRYPLSTPGRLTIGGANSAHWPHSLSFVGKISCLALYDHSLTESDKSQYDDTCKEEYWNMDPAVNSCPVRESNTLYEPVHLWPLTPNTTCDLQSPLGERALNVLMGPPAYDYFKKMSIIDFKVMSFFDGSPALLLRIPSADPLFRVTFAALVELNEPHETLEGTLMEYTMDPFIASRDVISRITVEITGGNVEVIMTTLDGSEAVRLTESASKLKDNEPKGVLVSWDLAEGLKITVDSDKAESVLGSFPRLPIGAPGYLQVGGGWGRKGGGDNFHGRVSCVSLYLDTSNEHGDFENRCSQLYTDVSSMDKEISCELPLMPTYLWPLDNVTGGHEALSGLSPLSFPEFSSCFQVDDSSPPTLTRPHLKFDGSRSSYLEVPVNDSVFSGDFTLVMFVKVDAPAEGVLLDYTAYSSSSPAITRLVLATNVNNSLQVSIWASDAGDSGSSILCCHEIHPQAFSAQPSWTMLLLGKEAGFGVYVSMNGTGWHHLGNNCSGYAVSEQQGRLTVGGARDDGVGAGFRGEMACLMLIPSGGWEFDASWYLELCENRSYAFSPDTQTCPRDTALRTDSFSLIKKNVQPDPSLHHPIKSVHVSSLVRCSAACLNTKSCRSFVLDVSKKPNMECQLYDHVTKLSLLQSAGKNYYEIK